MKEFLEIGVIVKPQGIRGEMKVHPMVDDVSRFSVLKEVYVNGEKRKVGKTRTAGENVFLFLQGVSDRNAAETLRGATLAVSREDAIKLPQGRYFIADLLGATLAFEDGETVGTLTEIATAHTDVFTGEKDGNVFRFPFLKDLVLGIENDGKKIVLSRKRFGETAVYED